MHSDENAVTVRCLAEFVKKQGFISFYHPYLIQQYEGRNMGKI